MKTLFIFFFAICSAVVSADEIIISKGVSESHKQKLEQDFHNLKNLEFESNIDFRALEILGLDELTSETAYSWLRERVSYIVEDQKIKFISQLKAQKKVLVLKSNVESYPVYNDPNTFFIPATESFDSSKGVVVMTNIGTGIYHAGKNSRELLGFEMFNGKHEDKINIPVTSPRTGIIMIGEGLFSSENLINKRKKDALSNSIKRLGTMFHEARHSDGNGSSLGFYHSPCPKGHELAKLSACDENSNGPYTVGALMMIEMVKACGDQCSLKEKEMLKAAILDSFGRVQKTTRKGGHAVDLDVTPESL